MRNSPPGVNHAQIFFFYRRHILWTELTVSCLFHLFWSLILAFKKDEGANLLLANNTDDFIASKLFSLRLQTWQLFSSRH